MSLDEHSDGAGSVMMSRLSALSIRKVCAVPSSICMFIKWHVSMAHAYTLCMAIAGFDIAVCSY